MIALAPIAPRVGQLKPVELDFVRSMTHWPGEPSEKQWRWLEAIASALGLEARI